MLSAEVLDLVSYVASLDYAPSISDLARQRGMHPDTVFNLLEAFVRVKSCEWSVEFLETRRGRVVRVRRCV